MRAYLIVPAGSPDSFGPALDSRPDALVLDGAGTDPAVLPGILADLRARALAVGSDARDVALWMRLSGVETPAVAGELAAMMPSAPSAIVVPVRHGRDLAHAGARLAVHEAEIGLPDGSTRIVALIADAAGALNAGSLVGASPRLAALGWDAGAISAGLRAERICEEGVWVPPVAQARALVRLAAGAAGIEAVETAFPEDEETAHAKHVAAARRDGFDAVFVTDPKQVALVRR